MKRVLIVDDERDITEALGELLEGKYEVKLAFDGAEALQILLEGGIDGVVLDLMMPTSGESLMAELKARGMHVPVIFASSATNLEERAKRSGAADFIAKPFDFDKLEAKLAHLLGEDGGGSPPRGSGGQRRPPPKASGQGSLVTLYRFHQVPARRAQSASSGCRTPAVSRRIAPAPPLSLN